MQPPIASPFGTPRDEEENRVFRFRLWRIFVATLSPMPAIALAFGALNWIVEPTMFANKYDRQVLAALLFALLVLPPLMNALTAFFLPLKVTPRGIYNGRFIEWEQMKAVSHPWWTFGYLKVALHGRRWALWIPLALSDFNGFARTLEEWAPDGNPLREWALGRARR